MNSTRRRGDDGRGVLAGAVLRHVAACLLVAVSGASLRAHSGPPFPIVSNQIAGAYLISIWTDPDATDDRSPAGQFWVMLGPAAKGVALPDNTRATVSIRPPGGAVQSGSTRPIDGRTSRQFVALLMDHEGPFAVSVSIDGPLGRAEIATAVDATYDLRPQPFMLILALMPFLLVGALWVKLLLRRRAAG